MKKVIIASMVSIACMAFININKIATNNIDNRDTFVGTYSCRQISFQRNTKQDKPLTTTTNTIMINITKDIVDSVLLLRISNKNMKFKLVNKHIYCIESGIHGGGNFYETDSLSFSFSIGRANSSNFIGKKD